MKLYLAGPLFSVAERQFNKHLAEALKMLGHDIWLPQDNEPRDKTARAIFEKDIDGVDWADAVVANMDGPDIDSGTAWECGYAYGRHSKPILAFRTDMRSADDGGLAPYNIMLAASVDMQLRLVGFDVYDIAKSIDSRLQAWFAGESGT